MVKAIIFDLDGVIAVSDKRFSDRLGISQELQDEFFKGIFLDLLVGKGDLKEELKKYAPKWGWRDSVEELLSLWFEGENVKDEGVINTIRELKKLGIKTYLATNQEKYRTEYARNKMGLGEIFEEVFSSSGVGYLKKEPEFWQFVLGRIQAQPKEILYWDDSEDHVEAAASAGIQAELYTNFEVFQKKVNSLMKLYRFSPIQNEKELLGAVHYVATKTTELIERVIRQKLPISSLTVFTHSQGEYGDLIKILNAIGSFYNENNGPRVVLYNPIKVGDNTITHLRIRKPDPERPQVGCNDFDVEDYNAFKEEHLSKYPNNLRLVEREDYEMIEFFDPEFDVLAYVVSK